MDEWHQGILVYLRSTATLDSISLPFGKEQKPADRHQLYHPPKGYHLALHLPPLADLGRETCLDSGHGAAGATVLAGDEGKPVLALLQRRVRRSTGLERA